jgi:nucleotide-binding universal stress UspA family protein
MFERILLSVDGSDDSNKALRATRELARLHGSEVFLVYGWASSALAAPVPSAPVTTRQCGSSATKKG